MVMEFPASRTQPHRQLLFTPPQHLAGPARRRMLPEMYNATWGLDILDQGQLPLDTIYHYTYNGAQHCILPCMQPKHVAPAHACATRVRAPGAATPAEICCPLCLQCYSSSGAYALLCRLQELVFTCTSWTQASGQLMRSSETQEQGAHGPCMAMMLSIRPTAVKTATGMALMSQQLWEVSAASRLHWCYVIGPDILLLHPAGNNRLQLQLQGLLCT